MTLKLDQKIDILKTCLHTENEFDTAKEFKNFIEDMG